MKKSKQLFSPLHVMSSILMLALLTWLTVCLPFVNQSQKAAKSQTEQSGKADNSNPLNNTNEERSENGASLLSEYLHEAPVLERHFTLLSSSFKKYPSDEYIAYHPDPIIPPPNA